MPKSIEEKKLTRNFYLREFAVSRQFPELAAKLTFDNCEYEKLFILCATILQPVREKYGRVDITSGKRSPDLNLGVGGSDNSQHLYCEAADFHTRHADLEEVHTWITLTLPQAFGQCLLYYRDNLIPDIIHVSLPSARIRSKTRVGYKVGGMLTSVKPR